MAPSKMTSTTSSQSLRAVKIDILNGTDQVFHPGDNVSGKIVLEPPNARVSSATIELSGVCETKSPVWGFKFRGRYISPTSDTYLFRHKKQLVVNNNCIDPFQMEFPECTSAEDVSRKINRLADGSLPLPPTFRVTKGNGADNAIGSIQYFVRAEVISERADGQGRSEHRDFVELQTGLKGSEPIPFLAPQATFKLHPVSRRCSDWRFGINSFKERLLRICPVTLPPVFVTGGKHPFRLELESERSDVDLALMPVQNLENAKIVLESHTDVAGYKFTKGQRRIQDKQIVHERGVLFPIQQRTTEIMITIPESSTPDFVTYTLQHTHKLKFTATVRIGREPFPVQSYSPIRIVPRPEYEYQCAIHGLTYSMEPSMMTTPNVDVRSPSIVSVCPICRHDDAERAARAIMAPIQEDLSTSDVHSLNTADEFEAVDQSFVSPELQPRQESTGAEQDERPTEKHNFLDTTSAEKDRPHSQANRSRDSAYVSAYDVEKPKSMSSLDLDEEDKAAEEKISAEQEYAREDESESPDQLHLAPGEKAAGKQIMLDEKEASEEEPESPVQMRLVPGGKEIRLAPEEKPAEGKPAEKKVSLDEKGPSEDKLEMLDEMQISHTSLPA
ncbi:uncharacterized protein J3D65DRAFT_668225 [Phyllosticta citribraziliensis]|uniref:Arrestin C-terminal-like domain-containing protein n=1 Tax=Phyllosticta citribraziliensis TaxID=989973 RepID=A0ABR1LKJ6_9PEZI